MLRSWNNEQWGSSRNSYLQNSRWPVKLPVQTFDSNSIFHVYINYAFFCWLLLMAEGWSEGFDRDFICLPHHLVINRFVFDYEYSNVDQIMDKTRTWNHWFSIQLARHLKAARKIKISLRTYENKFYQPSAHPVNERELFKKRF